MGKPVCNTELAKYNKEETGPHINLEEFRCMQNEYVNNVTVFTDASKEDDVGAAFIIEQKINYIKCKIN